MDPDTRELLDSFYETPALVGEIEHWDDAPAVAALLQDGYLVVDGDHVRITEAGADLLNAEGPDPEECEDEESEEIRFDWWSTSDPDGTQQYFHTLSDALIDLRDFDVDTAFQPGECCIRLRDTGEVWDVVDFLAAHQDVVV